MTLPTTLSLNYLLDIERIDKSRLDLTSIKRGFLNHYRLKGQDIIGWEKILAEARARFLSELAATNHLIDNRKIGRVLEIDDGRSQLATAVKQYGFQTETVNVSHFIDHPDRSTLLLLPEEMSTFGVTHTLLEHLPSLENVSLMLDLMAEKSEAMVHQVHESDIPAFNWDSTHRIFMTRQEWENFFREWTSNKEGWTYLGNHQGISGRPSNYVFDKDGRLPFYSYYDKQLIRKIIKEITAANAISISRIPLLLTSFALAKDNPVLLSALIATVFALDAVDGYSARKGLGKSPMGPHIDILSDHIVELATVFEFAYEMNAVPHAVPWVLATRDSLTDLLRLYNAFVFADKETHPHASFGTFDKVGRFASGAVKTIEGVTIPIIPSLGVHLSIAHVIVSLYRGIPLILSDRSRKIYRHLLERVFSKLRK